MNKTFSVPAVLFLLTAACTAHGQQRFRNNYTIEERETIRRTLEFSSGAGTKIVEVDTVYGSIHVTGYDGRNVEMVANKTIRAHSQEDLRNAKDRVKLDIADKADTVSLYVDQPGHQRSGRPSSLLSNRFDSSDPGYEVTFDFELRVPRRTEIRLGTINGSTIRVENVEGDFEVSNVNGGIEMTGISGSGRAQTINGPVDVKFAGNPSRSSSFKSMNGPVDVTFQRNLSADLRFKSFNGGVYTDFPVSALPAPVNTAQRRNGTFIYRNEFEGARIGNGGPLLEFDGFNGDVRIRQAK
jgi:hypothetical protein